MTRVELTPAALIASLSQIASASTEAACAQALVASAALLQSAVLDEQSSDEFHAALDAVTPELAGHLREALDRAVNFHLLDDGGTLGLWMVPVVLNTAKMLPSIIPLETKSLNAMKMSGCLLQQLGLSADQTGGDRTGWTYMLPALYSDAQIRNVDVGDLIRLPHEARAVVRGELDGVSFSAGEDQGAVNGSGLYFMPFVAYCPAGLPPSLPATSTKALNRMQQWIAMTLDPVLSDKFTCHIAPLPQPFTLALRVGERLHLDVKLRELMMRVTTDSGVQPNGLAALVAPYATRQDDGTYMIGVSLVARMTKNVVATLALPVETDDGQEELALALHILRDLGMEAIQQHTSPINTFACQHCGGVQFALPTLAIANRGLACAADGVH